MERRDKRDLTVFLAATFLFSWTAWILSGILRRQDLFLYDAVWFFAQAGAFAPTLAGAAIMTMRDRSSLKKNAVVILCSAAALALGAVISAGAPASIREFPEGISLILVVMAALLIALLMAGRYCYLNDGEERPRRPGRAAWILLAPLSFLVLFLAGWFAVNAGGRIWSVKMLEDGVFPFIGSVVIAFSMNLLLGGPLDEEFGWRGFLFPLLLKNSNANGAGAMLGVIMSLWHLPIDITGRMGIMAVIFRLIFAVPYSLICTWFFIRSGGSILVALLAHAAVNVLPDMGFSGYDTSLVLFTVFMWIAALFVAFRPEMRK